MIKDYLWNEKKTQIVLKTTLFCAVSSKAWLLEPWLEDSEGMTQRETPGKWQASRESLGSGRSPDGLARRIMSTKSPTVWGIKQGRVGWSLQESSLELETSCRRKLPWIAFAHAEQSFINIGAWTRGELCLSDPTMVKKKVCQFPKGLRPWSSIWLAHTKHIHLELHFLYTSTQVFFCSLNFSNSETLNKQGYRDSSLVERGPGFN